MKNDQKQNQQMNEERNKKEREEKKNLFKGGNSFKHVSCILSKIKKSTTFSCLGREKKEEKEKNK